MWSCQKNFSFHGLSFSSFDNGVFGITEALQFHEVPFVNCLSCSCAITILSRKLSPVSLGSRMFPFSFIRFMLSGLIFKTLIYLGLSKVIDKYLFAFFYTEIFSKSSIVCWLLFYPLCNSGFFIINKIPKKYGFISGYFICFHWSTCLFLCKYSAVFNMIAF